MIAEAWACLPVTPLGAVGAVIVVGAPWMIRQLMQFTIFFINKIPEMTK
jgi:flagellar biosynthesis protein FliQ